MDIQLTIKPFATLQGKLFLRRGKKNLQKDWDSENLEGQMLMMKDARSGVRMPEFPLRQKVRMITVAPTMRRRLPINYDYMEQHHLTVVQLNCGRSGDVMHDVLESGLALKADFVFIQEPPVFEEYSHVGYNLIRGGRALIAARKGSTFHYMVRKEVAQAAAGDVIVLDVWNKKGRARLVNVYDQVDQKAEEEVKRPARRLDWDEIIRGNCFLAGDFNAHSRRWSCPGNPRDHVFWERVMDRNDIWYAGNHQPTRSNSVLDLLFVTGRDSLGYIDFQVIEADDHFTPSDHEMLLWRVDEQALELGEDLAPASKLGGWKIKELIEEMESSAKSGDVHPAINHWQQQIERIPSLPECATIGEIDDRASMLGDIISDLMDRFAKRAKIVPRSKKWWSKEIRALRKEAGAAKRKRHWSPEYQEAANKARNQYTAAKRRAKRECWHEWLQGAHCDRVWDVLRGTKSRKSVDGVERLVGENGEEATTANDKRKLLASISFPVQNPAPPRWDSKARAASVGISREAISKALLSPANGKAPGPDGITVELLRYLDKSTPGFMVDTIQAAFKTGHHPFVWRQARGVVIPKPGKDDYSKAKSFRTISLLNVMGKVLERVVADFLNDHMESRGGFHPGQFGGRRRLGAPDAVARMVMHVQRVWKRGQMAGLLCMDIKGAFPTTNAAVLQSVLKDQETPDNIVKWVGSFMSQRTVGMEIDGELGTLIEYRSGLPQGSPTSPVLFNVLMSDMARFVEKKISQKNIRHSTPPPSWVPGSRECTNDQILHLSYLDDVAWVVGAKSSRELSNKMTECANWTMEWGRSAGVIFEEDKTEVLVFAGPRRTTRKELERTYVTVGTTKIPLETKPIRWLGFILDAKLKFDEHHRLWSGKARKRQAQIRRLCVNKGLPAFSAANLQKAVVQSVSTYGIEIYAVLDKREMPLWQLKDLQIILNEQARRATGLFKTTPVGVLMAEGAMKPAKAILERRTLGFSLRQIAAPELESENNPSPTTEEVDKAVRERCKWNLGLGGKNVEQTYPERREDISRGLFVCLDREGAKIQAQRGLSEGEFRVFTDGSCIEKTGAGAGVAVMETSGRFTGTCFSLGKGQEAYDAELFAVWQGLEAAKRSSHTVKKISVFLDAQAAMTAIRRDCTGPGQTIARAIRQTERELDNAIRVTYNWVPGHCGVPGNKKADELAKLGAEGHGERVAFPSTLTSADTMTTLAHVRRGATEWTGKIARAEVLKLLKPHKAMGLSRPLGMRKAFKPSGEYLPPKKKDTAVFSQMACGHALTGQHLHRFKQRRSDRCWWCNSGARQTRGHLFGGCSRFRKQYRVLVDEVNRLRKDRKRDKWKEGNVRQLFEEEGYELALIAYMKETGIGYVVDPEVDDNPVEWEDPLPN